MPKKSAGQLVWRGRRREPETSASSGSLSWQQTEFGRRTPDGAYRIIRSGRGWQLLNAAWEIVGAPVGTMREAQDQAERLARRAGTTGGPE